MNRTSCISETIVVQHLPRRCDSRSRAQIVCFALGCGGELDLETSNTQAKAIFDVTAYPLFQQAPSAVPEGQRRGPLVTDDSGMPVRRRYYQDLYRDVADAAGVPRAVWNMLARHGGATEARQAGVALADIAEHVQHADLNTTRKHYIVPSVETSRRVAKQRVAHRQAKKNTP